MPHKSSHIERLKGLGIFRGQLRLDPLEGGITNLNYRVADDAGEYVARICQERPSLGICRRNEAACQTAAWRLGLAPELIYHQDGLMVSRFVPGRPLLPADFEQPRLLELVARLLHRLHGESDSLTGEFLSFCPFRTIRTYADTAAKLGPGCRRRSTT
jgi:hypothetical protein